jgi:ribosomal protein L2
MKTYKPITKSQRARVSINYNDYLTTQTPHKALVKGIKRHVGRNKPWAYHCSTQRWRT